VIFKLYVKDQNSETCFFFSRNLFNTIRTLGRFINPVSDMKRGQGKKCFWKRRKFTIKWYTTLCIYVKTIVKNCVTKFFTQTKKWLFWKGANT